METAERDFEDVAELPCFARFLADYEIPERCRGDHRFGVRCYHHAGLLETAQQSGKTAGFVELLQMFKESNLRRRVA